jgi:4'-phosphopantetheinyl transferase
MPAPASHLDRGDVCVYVDRTAAFAADSQRLAHALDMMSPAERERFDRFRHDADRLMFALGREMARRLVSRALGVAPDAWTWREGPHGRPEIAEPATDLRFNLSHSAGVVALAMSRGRDVGIDVEDLSRRSPDQAIVRRYCSPEETTDVLGRAGGWHERFLTYWTLKEAYLKARGLGIAVHLADISFDVDPTVERAQIAFARTLAGTDDRWLFRLMRIDPHHLGAVAVETVDGHRPEIVVEPY